MGGIVVCIDKVAFALQSIAVLIVYDSIISPWDTAENPAFSLARHNINN